jgi:exodeoxyribonuclease VII large subunit
MTDDTSLIDNTPEYSVSELSGALKRAVEGNFQRVRVRGEISGFKRAASGHLYLSLKDDKAVLDTVVWRGVAGNLGMRPEDGLEVVCEGRLTTYAARSRYQLVVESMSVAGAGALLALLDERRRTLAAEGLFDAERKRPLPALPERIGVVTSPTGAVIRDILHRLADRFPRPVLLWPVRVQGKGADAEIAAAIRGFDALAADDPLRPDLLIIARGGGSIEDLWSFNEEGVVRAAADCTIPLISAVGHETDTTLIDLAADVRAPTPTAAAEMAVPVRVEILADLGDYDRRMATVMARRLDGERRAVEALARGLPRPGAMLEDAAQRLDERGESLRRVMTTLLARRSASLAEMAAGLVSPQQQAIAAGLRLQASAHRLHAAGTARLREAGDRLGRWIREPRLQRAGERRLASARERLAAAAARLESVSYRSVLSRGFAVVHDSEGELVRDSAAARRAGMLEIEFHDGRVPAQAGSTPRRRRGGGDDSQGSLL